MESTPQKPTGKTSLICSRSCLVGATGELDYCKDLRTDCDIYRTVVFRKFENSGIYKRYWSCNFKSMEAKGVPGEVKKSFDQARTFAKELTQHTKEGRGLLIKGPVGTMKTSLAVAVLQEQLTRGKGGLFITMASLLDTIFTLKARDKEEWIKFENRVKDIPLLVLDDLGSENTEGWVMTKVDAIISERYNRCRSTIITTNLSTDQLKGVYAERIIDRLRSTMTVINCHGRSLR